MYVCVSVCVCAIKNILIHSWRFHCLLWYSPPFHLIFNKVYLFII